MQRVARDLFDTTGARNDRLVGRKLDGRYEVLSLLGEGGMGVVDRGRQVQLGRFVAIKVLRQDAAAGGRYPAAGGRYLAPSGRTVEAGELPDWQ